MKNNKKSKRQANANSIAPDIGVEAGIRQRAYELWELSGRVHGQNLEHWLQARVEILGPGCDKEVPE